MTKKELVRQELKNVLISKQVSECKRYLIYKCANTIDRMVKLTQTIKSNTGCFLIIRKNRNGTLNDIELSDKENERVDICIAI